MKEIDFMPRSYSLAVPVTCLLLLVSFCAIFGTYKIGINALELSLITREHDNNKQIRLLVETIIQEKINDLELLVDVLETHQGITSQLTQIPQPGNDFSFITKLLEPKNIDQAATHIDIINRTGVLVYTSDSIHESVDINEVWGIEEALDGEQLVATSKVGEHWVVRAMGPLRSAGKIIGAIVLGIEIDDLFLKEIAFSHHSDISFQDIGGLIVGDVVSFPPETHKQLTHFLTQWGASIEQVQVFFSEDMGNKALFMIAPLRIIDETFCLVVRSDISEMYHLLDSQNRQMIGFSLVLFSLVAGLGTFFAYWLTKPLRKLRERTEEWAMEYSTTPINSIPINEIKALIFTFESLQEVVIDHIHKQEQTEKALQQATETKGIFLANMSHEIRTPMNGVIGMTSLLMETELTLEQQEYLTAVKASGNALLTVINDILDYSKVEAGKLELEHIDFDLSALLEEITDTLALEAHSKGLELVLLMDNTIPPLLHGDSGRIRQILTNLGNNACKFTHSGEVVIQASLEDENDSHASCRLQVTDTGIGIPQDRINSLFQSFSQIDASTTRKYGGTGLGLAISKQLVELMGGEIGVTSQEGKGSTFWFTVLLGKQPEGLEIQFSEPLHIGTKRILIVDDNSNSRQVIKNFLTSWKCRYEEAANRHQVFKKLRDAITEKDPFDIVILDKTMPDLDGQEFAEIMKDDEELRPITMVMLTPLGQLYDRAHFTKIGFSSHLSKPVKRNQLLSCLLETTQDAEPLIEPPGKIQAFTDVTPAAQGSKIKHILVAEDNDINQMVIMKILDKLGYRTDVAANGREAVEAITKKTYDLILMDVQMPEMDGLEATSIIRNSPSSLLNNKIPIIALTAHAMKGDLERCINAGMNDYATKPVAPKELSEKIDKWLP